MNKRFLIFLLLSFLLTLGGLFYFFWVRLVPQNLSVANTDSPFQKYVAEKIVNRECSIDQSIEYFYYTPSDWARNNKFGLYIYAENADFFEIAQNLVNSNGGDWGYVLIPYNVSSDRDVEKWARVFAQLRSKHLIPIVQLWDVDVNDYEDQTEEAAEFLNQFVWPVKERYISAYNEMNSRAFWYGEINPAQYAEILDHTIDAFKEEDADFFIMNGAFNISAASDGQHLDAFAYMFQMDQQVPGIFSKLDGWASHSYPQPNFAGSPYSTGRWSIQAYENELSYLKNTLGVQKDLPVFITETGWAHAEGANYDSSFLTIDQISNNFRIAFEEVWLLDPRVRAVTPFTIKYEPPFDHFSWVNEDNVPYRHYDVVKDIAKVAGNPPHIDVKTVDLSTCE